VPVFIAGKLFLKFLYQRHQYLIDIRKMPSIAFINLLFGFIFGSHYHFLSQWHHWSRLLVDYTKETIGNGNIQYDIIFGTVGKTSKNICRNILKPNGKCITVLSGIAIGKQEDLDFFKDLVKQNKYTVIIDKCYKFGRNS
jgi:hypothetical protein